jgi:hypothetical protein
LLRVIAPVKVGKEVSSLFTFAKEIEIDLLRAKLLVELGKTPEMIFCSRCGVSGASCS